MDEPTDSNLGPRRLLAIAALILIPVVAIGYRAWTDPEIAFLTPSPGGVWVRHPQQDVVGAPANAAQKEAEFRRCFDGRSVKGARELRVRAFGTTTVSLDGSPLVARGQPDNWKTPARFDLGPIGEAGRICLAVRVDNARGLPLLEVTALSAGANRPGEVALLGREVRVEEEIGL